MLRVTSFWLLGFSRSLPLSLRPVEADGRPPCSLVLPQYVAVSSARSWHRGVLWKVVALHGHLQRGLSRSNSLNVVAVINMEEPKTNVTSHKSDGDLELPTLSLPACSGGAFLDSLHL